MKKLFLLFIPIILFLISYLSKEKTSLSTSISLKKATSLNKDRYRLNCVECFEQYVEDVINNGLDIFHYPSGAMPAGTVSKEEAKKIAAFMATLQGFTPTNVEYVEEGKALFYGNCTGCHGVEGKGQEGYFPDLTKRPLEGFKRLATQ
ncbi:MAG: c-type cytochrome [Epsilonproteobacteria bacterium]|nr:c-type cytochrome [Campylobacterota bacterium]